MAALDFKRPPPTDFGPPPPTQFGGAPQTQFTGLPDAGIAPATYAPVPDQPLLQTSDLRSSVLTVDELPNYLREQGIDLTNPAIAYQLASNAARQMLVDQLNSSSSVYALQGLRLRAPLGGAAVGSYDQALQDAGFFNAATGQPTPQPDQTTAQTQDALHGMGAPEAAPNQAAQSGFDTNPANGDMHFKNGVLVTTAADGNPTLYFPPGKSVPGSLPWVHAIQDTWTTSKIKEWQQKLNQMGYSVGKPSGKFDTKLSGALQQYWRNYYLNGGKAISAGPAVGPTGNTITPLNSMRGTIQQDVKNQFVSIYGQQPTPDELSNWTDFVMKTGMKLQQNQGLTASESVSEAVNRQSTQAQQTPGAQWAYDESGNPIGPQAKFNTSLSDALTNAVVATHGIM